MKLFSQTPWAPTPLSGPPQNMDWHRGGPSVASRQQCWLSQGSIGGEFLSGGQILDTSKKKQLP